MNVKLIVLPPEAINRIGNGQRVATEIKTQQLGVNVAADWESFVNRLCHQNEYTGFAHHLLRNRREKPLCKRLIWVGVNGRGDKLLNACRPVDGAAHEAGALMLITPPGRHHGHRPFDLRVEGETSGFIVPPTAG